jgi:hypothetical protein
LGSIDVDVECTERNTPVVQIISDAYTINSFVGYNQNLSHESTNISWGVKAAERKTWSWAVLGNCPGEDFLTVVFTVVAVAQDDEPSPWVS